MQKLIIFSALIACALASWAPSSKHSQQSQVPHHAIASHEGAVGHAEHATGIRHGHNAGVGHGQLESVHHGGGAVFPNKEFRRIKKGQHQKHVESNRGKNHLRRVHSGKHYRH